MDATTIDDLDALRALTHPVRLEILRSLGEPASASGLAARLGETRQRVNYHLRELERAGLVSLVEERTKRNMIERLYQATSRSYVVSPRLTWGDEHRRAVRSQVALDHLVRHGERVQADAAALLDRAIVDDAEVPSATVSADVHFADESSRQAFMAEYLALVGDLLERHAAPRGTRFNVAVAVYPDPALRPEPESL